MGPQAGFSAEPNKFSRTSPDISGGNLKSDSKARQMPATWVPWLAERLTVQKSNLSSPSLIIQNRESPSLESFMFPDSCVWPPVWFSGKSKREGDRKGVV